MGRIPMMAVPENNNFWNEENYQVFISFMYYMGNNVTVVNTGDDEFYYIINKSGNIYGSPEALFLAWQEKNK